MQIRKMFDRKIDRDIKGVIKVGQDDDANIKQELEEYVVTNELNQHFGVFFDAYKRSIEAPTDKIGVWISGFFGSGKSHFLKILSYLIENRKIDGKKAMHYFDGKIHDGRIIADMEMADDITTDVVLFDIDAKSESDSMSDKDSIVKVLNKVFNEMQGFCGAIPWIAEIERNMQDDGVYEDFKAQFKAISGNRWEDAREDFYYEEDAIIEALTHTTGMSQESARNWFDRAEQEYTISIDRFARRVKAYIDHKGDKHHVAFLIDEVGQYIGDNSNAMLNLQTIVHEFGRHCKGKAWIAVTSQEDIDSVLAVKGNDFSKIQGRFDTKLSLSSAFVDEVIQKRILEKNEAGAQTLREVYRKNSSILQNLLTFSGSAEMKRYTDEAHFVDVYPFIPYQFHLLQRVFTGVRIHGASGKHLAEGERSLLSAFQESAVRFAHHEANFLVPFSTFYETIETFLDSSIRTVIIQAGKNDKLEPYDIAILKLLFLIKYVKEMPSNLENIATLMVDGIHTDKIALKKKIEASLARLTQQTLIQKNGDAYVFLTNDEQDVNREIKNMPVEIAEIIQKIGNDIFTNIYKDKKFRYSPKYHFSFNVLIDDRPIRSQTDDFGIRILTPYRDPSLWDNASELKMMSMRENNVIFKLPSDTAYLEEMIEIEKIQAYLRLNSGTAVSQTIEDIKTRKSREVSERKTRVTTYLIEAIKLAEVFINGQQIEMQKKDPAERINEGFQSLAKTIYHKLDYITTFTETAKDLENVLASPKQLSADETLEENHLALQEVDQYIDRLSARKQQMSVKHMTSYFASRPYGWMELDTTAVLIELFKAQEIHFYFNGARLHADDKQLIQHLTKRDKADRVVVKKRERISAVLVENAKKISKALFHITALPADEDGIMHRLNELFTNELGKIDRLLGHYRHTNYPGEDVLTHGKKAIETLLHIQDTATYFKQLHILRNDLQGYAKDVPDVIDFFENQQAIFDNAKKKLNIFENNRTYVTDRQIHDIVSKMNQIVRHTEPYDYIQELPGLALQFDEVFLELLEAECKPVKERIQADYRFVMEQLEAYPTLRALLKSPFKERFENLKSRLDHTNNLYEAVAMQVESDRLKVRCLDEVEREKRKEQNRQLEMDRKKREEEGKPEVDVPEVVPEKRVKTLSKHRVIQGTKTLDSKEDIDQFVDELKTTLLDALEDDTTIHLV